MTGVMGLQDTWLDPAPDLGASPLDAVLPAGAVGACTVEDDGDTMLHPEEIAYLVGSSPGRCTEFTAVRACVARALAQFGLERPAQVPQMFGAPVWPDGIVGAMTHCAGFRAAAVARADRLATLGIDAEPHRPLSDGVLEEVASPSERARLAELAAGWPDIAWGRILFSAKESVYKVWFPVERSWLGFFDADVELFPDGTLTARLLAEPLTIDGHGLRELTGSWAVRDGVLMTGIGVPR